MEVSRRQHPAADRRQIVMLGREGSGRAPEPLPDEDLDAQSVKLARRAAPHGRDVPGEARTPRHAAPDDPRTL